MELPNQSVDGRRFVQALRGLITDFGNVDQKFLDKVNAIAKESELAARDIFGLQEKDISTLQKEVRDCSWAPLRRFHCSRVFCGCVGRALFLCKKKGGEVRPDGGTNVAIMATPGLGWRYW